MADTDKAPQGGRIIKMQNVARSSKFDAEKLLAQLCYHYPQYTLNEAQKLSFRQVNLLLKVARQEQAIQMYNLTQIAAAPHSKKGQGVTKLTEHFKKQANG